MASNKRPSGPDAKAGRAKLQEVISRGAAGAKARAAMTLPGNEYVTVSDWTGDSSGGVISSVAIVTPVNDSIILTIAGMFVLDGNGSAGGGGFFTVLEPGAGAVVAGAGSGAGNFVAILFGFVFVNSQLQEFAFMQNF